MLYLAYLDGEDPGEDLGGTGDIGGVLGPWRELFGLRPGLLLVDSDQSRSTVYHALKDLLPPRTPLLVAALDGPPKFRGMTPGALTWVRARASGALRYGG